MAKPKTFAALVRAGGPDHFAREAAEQAARFEREHWLAELERGPVPNDAVMAALHAKYIRDLRRQLGLGQPLTVVREQTRERVQRKRALGGWGEKKAVDLLKRAGFRNVRDMNAETVNHPFGDIYAERDGARYLIGVKTRNKYQVSGLINPTYNVRKRGADVKPIAKQYNATLAWVAIAVVPEEQGFSAYFGTIAQIEDAGERFSIPMRPEQTKRYECLSRPTEEVDEFIRREWSNGGYASTKRISVMPSHQSRRATTKKATPTIVTFDDHASYTDAPRRPILLDLRNRVLRLDDRLRRTEQCTGKQRIAYNIPGGRIFLEVKVQRAAIVLHLADGGCPDPNGIAGDIAETHGWHQLKKRITILNMADLDAAMPFVEAAYRARP